MHRAAEVAERSLFAAGFDAAIDELEAQIEAVKERSDAHGFDGWDVAMEAVVSQGRARYATDSHDVSPTTQALQLLLQAYEKQAEEIKAAREENTQSRARSLQARESTQQMVADRESIIRSIHTAAKAAGCYVEGGGNSMQLAALTEAARKGAAPAPQTINVLARGEVPADFEEQIRRACEAAAFRGFRAGEVEILKKQVTELQKRSSELMTENRGLREAIEEYSRPPADPFANVAHFMAINRFEIGREPHVPGKDRPDGILIRLGFIFDEVIELIEACVEVFPSIGVGWKEATSVIRDSIRLAPLSVKLPQLAAEATDVAYSAFGLLLAVGYEPAKVWRVVHAANMQKIPDGIRPRKPDGWVPPSEMIAGWSK